jgi:hypothetical protein
MERTGSEKRIIAGNQWTASWGRSPGEKLVNTIYPNGFTAANDHDAVANLGKVMSVFAGNLITNIDRNAAGAWTLVHYGNRAANPRTFKSKVRLASWGQILKSRKGRQKLRLSAILTPLPTLILRAIKHFGRSGTDPANRFFLARWLAER